jgi:hypothetical protein
MDVCVIGDLGEDEEYDSQQEKNMIPVPILGEEAKKSSRARPRAGIKRAASTPDGEVSMSVGESGGDRARKKRTEDKVRDEDPSPKLALASLQANAKYKDSHDVIKVDGACLHCNLCGTTFGTRSNVWKNHLKGKRHVDKLAKRRGMSIQNAFQAQGKKDDAKAEQAHRLRVAEAFFEQGIELNKCRGKLKELLEEVRPMRLSVGDASNLARQVMDPLTKAQDEDDLQVVLAGNSRGTFIFDGYSRKDEHSAVVLRVCTSEFEIVERLVSCKIFQKGLNAKQWLRVVDTERRRLSSIEHEFHLVFTVADGHPSNGIVGEQLSGTLEHYFHSFCYSHTLAKVGTNCKSPLVDKFVTSAGAVFKNSPGARSVFARIAMENVKRKHKVRWFSTTDVIEQAIRKSGCWAQVVQAIEDENGCAESLPRLKELITENSTGYSDLWLEMSAVFDVTRTFYTVTTFFEGASFLSPFVWRYIRTLRQQAEKILNTVDPGIVLPNVSAIIRSVPPHVNTRSLWGTARQAVDPGLEYFLDHCVRFKKDSKARQFRKADSLFGFARILHPVYAREWIDGKEQGTPAFNLKTVLDNETVKDTLQALGEDICEDLTADFGRYVSCLELKVEAGKKYRPDDVLDWWRANGSAAGSWAGVARLFTLLQPSSASVERAFSMLRGAVTEHQERMLEDQQELRIRKRFNNKNKSAYIE